MRSFAIKKNGGIEKWVFLLSFWRSLLCRGIAAIVISVLAVILAIAMTNTTATIFKTLHEKAVEYKPDGLWAQVSENYNSGLMGLIKTCPRTKLP